MAQVMDLFKVTLIILALYSTCITILTYSLPADMTDRISSFNNLDSSFSTENIAEEIQGSIQSQTSIPVVDLGALVFYSGNILIDLLLNFAFAIPQIIGLLLYGLFSLIGIDTNIQNTIQIFASVIILVVYFVALIQLLTGVRSGRIV